MSRTDAAGDGGVTLTVSSEVVNRIESRVDRTEFDTASEYAEFALRELLTRVESESDASEYESVSDEEVESRLRSLGYLDE